MELSRLFKTEEAEWSEFRLTPLAHWPGEQCILRGTRPRKKLIKICFSSCETKNQRGFAPLNFPESICMVETIQNIQKRG